MLPRLVFIQHVLAPGFHDHAEHLPFGTEPTGLLAHCGDTELAPFNAMPYHHAACKYPGWSQAWSESLIPSGGRRAHHVAAGAGPRAAVLRGRPAVRPEQVVPIEVVAVRDVARRMGRRNYKRAVLQGDAHGGRARCGYSASTQKQQSAGGHRPAGGSRLTTPLDTAKLLAHHAQPRLLRRSVLFPLPPHTREPAPSLTASEPSPDTA